MRINLKRILQDPILCKDMMTRVIVATQAREGVITTMEQAEQAYDKARGKSK